MTISELILKGYKQKPKKTVIVDKCNSVTYEDLYKQVSFTSGRLLELGLKKGDKVCLMLDNGLQYIYCFFALVSIGCIIIPMDKNIKTELVLIANNSGSKMIIAEKDVVDHIIPELNKMPSIEYVYVNQYTGSDVGISPLDELLIPVGEEFEGFRHQVDKDDIACFIYTSGTVKKPKGVMLTHYNLLFNVTELNDAVEAREDDVFFNILPFYHCYGLCTNLLLPMYVGATIVLHDNFNLRDIIEAVQNTKSTVLSCVPTMLEKMKEMIASSKSLFDIKYISSGAPLPSSLIKYYYENYGISIINAYGSSETNTIAVNRDCYNSRQSSVGKLLPSLKVRIINGDNEDLPEGTEGEIVLKTPKLMKGYYDMPEETEKVLKDGWFYTGDIGYVSKQRELFITGRKKDMFCVAGKKVYRHDVEEVLMSSGYFSDVYVDSEESTQRGEKIIASVVLKDIARTEDEILKYCRRMMSAHKVPKEIRFCDVINKKKTWKTNI